MNRQIVDINEGLIKIIFPFHNQVREELAMRTNTVNHLFDNPVFCFRDGLRQYMRGKDMGFGDKFTEAIPGYEICDEHIIDVNGRTINLNNRYTSSSNLNFLLVPCNSPYFNIVTQGLLADLKEAGFDTSKSRWDDYKAWEKEKLRTLS